MDFIDPYEDISIKNVIYITENIPITENEELFNDIFSTGCKCDNFCLESKCSCIKSSINYNTNDRQLTRETLHTKYVLNSEKSLNGFYECNINCTCNQICGNRLVQYGPRYHLKIENCDQKGLGLFTTKSILKGNFICEYAGEVITKCEANKRYKYNKEKRIMNYIICVKEHFGEVLQETLIDPTYFGNIGRFLNHSCDPNCELIPVRINNLVPRLCLFAKKDIKENNELTFDYGDGNVSNFDINKTELKECFCCEKICRKWMPFNEQIAK